LQAGCRALAGKHVGIGGRESLLGKQRRVRNAARKRDDIRPLQQFEQLADLGCLHSRRTRREGLFPFEHGCFLGLLLLAPDHGGVFMSTMLT
jgi:hypothetical protein